jgi:hypothetical protein
VKHCFDVPGTQDLGDQRLIAECGAVLCPHWRPLLRNWHTRQTATVSNPDDPGDSSSHSILTLNNTMFARALRSSCARVPQRPQGLRAVARIGYRYQNKTAGRLQQQLRVLTMSRSLRNNQKTPENPQQQPKTPELASQAAKQGDASANRTLAAEAASKNQQKADVPTPTNKEQRKADWAIMREMAKYLWPKVWMVTRVD